MSNPPRPAATQAAPPETAIAASPEIAARMKSWRRRSGRIAVMRRWLPRIGIALVSFTVLWMAIRAAIALITASDFQNGDVHMLNPQFLGRDDKGKPYSVVAKDAVRNTHHPDIVHLTAPILTLQADSGKPMRMTARTGELDQTKHLLLLQGDVFIEDDKGDTFRSERTVIDTEAASARGDSAVVGDGPLGHITASSYSISSHGEHIVFEGGVRSRLNMQPKAAPKAEKPKK